MVLKIVKTVWPVMLTYVAIAAPCGMIMAQTGMGTLDGFCLSSTFVTGSGQFMVCNLWLGRCACGIDCRKCGRNLLALCALLGIDRTALRGASKRQTLAVAATLTEEAYGIRLPSWLKGRIGVRSSPLCST